MDLREVPLPAFWNHIPLQYVLLYFQAELSEMCLPLFPWWYYMFEISTYEPVLLVQ